MKLFPCSHCGKHALHPPTRRFPRGMPAVFGRVTSNPTVNKCFRCGRASRYSIVELNRLPHMTLDDFESLEMRDLALADLVGLGLTEREAEELFRASENSKASNRQGVWAETAGIEELSSIVTTFQEHKRNTEAA